MDRSNYIDGVEVKSTQLQNTENSKAFNIQRRFADATRSGRVSGLNLTINGSSAFKFDVSSGWGYTSRGDYVELSSAIQAITTDIDYRSGVYNYFVLAYREESSTPQAHETDGTSRNTIIARSSELKVLSATAYAALDSNSIAGSDMDSELQTADLTIDAAERICLVGVVIGKGFTGPTPVSYTSPDLGLNILQQTHLSALYSAYFGTTNITGVNITSISTGTPTSLSAATNGTLEFSYSTGIPRVRWRAPGDSFGAYTNITTPSTGRVQTVSAPSFTSSYTIGLEVALDVIPLPSAGTVTDPVVVSLFYDDLGGVFTSEDSLHRSKIGSLIPTTTNPHGMGHQDFGQSVVNMDVPLLLGNNFFGAVLSQLARLVTPRDDSGAATRTLMWTMSGGTANIRFYKNTSEDLSITYNAYWVEGTTLWTKDDTADRSWMVAMGSSGSSLNFFASGTATWVHADWQSQLSVGSPTTTNGLFNPGLGYLSTIADSLYPRINSHYANSGGISRTLLYQSHGDTTTGGTIKVYRVSGSATNGIADALEIVHNATWSGGGSTWSRDSAADATKLILGFPSATGGAVVMLVHRLAASTNNWNDALSGAGWENYSFAGASNGNVDISGNLSVEGSFSSVGSATVSTLTTTATTGTHGTFTQKVNLTEDAPLPPLADTFYANMIPKAMGRLSISLPDGAITIWSSLNVVGGVTNVQSLTSARSGVTKLALHVQMSAPTDGLNYIILPHLELSNTSSVDSIDNPVAIYAEPISVNAFAVFYHDGESGLIDITDDSENQTNRHITFMVWEP